MLEDSSAESSGGSGGKEVPLEVKWSANAQDALLLMPLLVQLSDSCYTNSSVLPLQLCMATRKQL